MNILILYFFSVWKKGTGFTDLSKAAIKWQKLESRSGKGNGKYARSLFRSCPQISVKIGSYFNLTETFILCSIQAVLEFTISLLLTT